MVRTILGSRIRERRRQIGVTQAELARRIGISASYLNLIERNKRRISGALLHRTAQELSVSLDDLDAVEEQRLLATLREVAHLPTLATAGIEGDQTGELIGRTPGWARGIAMLAAAERDATARARTLADRMTHDPFLGETVHKMLTRISAIRSAAEILGDYSDIPAEDSRHFNRIVLDEARVLSEVGEALAGYFSQDATPDRTLTPLDEVEALFLSSQNRFPEIEAEVARLGITVPDGQVTERWISARKLAADYLERILETLLDGQRQVRTEAARDLARDRLIDYAAGALLVPEDALLSAAKDADYDAEALAHRFGTAFQTICHRLAALGWREEGPSFGYMQANAAGTLMRLLALDGLNIPRYAAACPLWVLYRAQQMPETVMLQRAHFLDGGAFVFAARARQAGAPGFGKPRHYVTDMLILRESDVSQTIYRTAASQLPEEVGPACRLCPRTQCPHRTDDPFLA